MPAGSERGLISIKLRDFPVLNLNTSAQLCHICLCQPEIVRLSNESDWFRPHPFCPWVMGCVYLFTVAYNELLPLSLSATEISA